MDVVFLGTASSVILPKNLQPREYINPCWLDCAAFVALVIVIYLIYKGVLRNDE
jgi:hypothetical protein